MVTVCECPHNFQAYKTPQNLFCSCLHHLGSSINLEILILVWSNLKCTSVLQAGEQLQVGCHIYTCFNNELLKSHITCATCDVSIQYNRTRNVVKITCINFCQDQPLQTNFFLIPMRYLSQPNTEEEIPPMEGECCPTCRPLPTPTEIPTTTPASKCTPSSTKRTSISGGNNLYLEFYVLNLYLITVVKFYFMSNKLNNTRLPSHSLSW